MKIICLIFLLFYTFSAHADTVYSWKDSSGNTHFGNKLPGDAKEIKKLSSTAISRYSSSKLLKPLQNSLINSSSATSITPETIKTEKIPPSEDPRAALKEETLISDLEKSPLNIKYNEKNEITACSINLKNTSAIPASNVLVTFEFEDGTLIPATGMDSIPPDTTARYEIPKEMFPIMIRGSENSAKKPEPKVDVKVGS